MSVTSANKPEPFPYNGSCLGFLCLEYHHGESRAQTVLVGELGSSEEPIWSAGFLIIPRKFESINHYL